MKYIAPYGSADPNASYQDRNTPGAIAGSKVPAAAIEHPQREIDAVIRFAGLDPSSTDLTQLLQALQFMIDAATGGAGDENYVLMTQARLRLPFFPDVLTSEGKIPVYSPGSGQVRVPAGYDFLHRGIFNVTSVQADFATAPNKTYHIRWNPTTGFALKDLADAGYNAGAIAETATAFDSQYDDMLLAKIVTNASNVPTVTPLANKSQLTLETLIQGTNRAQFASEMYQFTVAKDYNWARRPTTFSLTRAHDINASSRGDSDFGIGPLADSVTDNASLGVDRYRLSQTVFTDYSEALRMHYSARA